MWIHFNFVCSQRTQLRLHKLLRSKIYDWKSSEAIRGLVLTYRIHPHRAPTDSLYLCLNIPSIRLPETRNTVVSEETKSQVPEEIMRTVERLSSENLTNPSLDKLEILDYEMELLLNNAPLQYQNAPVPEIINFASEGTEIALQILEDSRTRNRTWKDDKEIIEAIRQLVNERLSSQRERELGFHFAFNPLGWGSNIESYLRDILNGRSNGVGRRALDLLYRIEELE